MLLSALWAAGLTAVLLDPGLLRGDAEPAEQQLAALRDEIEALRADLMVVRTQSLGAQSLGAQPLEAQPPEAQPPEAQQAAAAAAASGEPEAAARPSVPASVAAAAIPPASGRGSSPPAEVASEPKPEAELGVELGPPELAAGFPDVLEVPATYRMLQGEGLLHVADRFGISLEAIVAVNGISDIDNVPVGMLLVLPSPAPALP